MKQPKTDYSIVGFFTRAQDYGIGIDGFALRPAR